MNVIDENSTSLVKAETTCTRLDLGILLFVLPRFVIKGSFVRRVRATFIALTEQSSCAFTATVLHTFHAV